MISRNVSGLFFLIFSLCQLVAQEPSFRIRRFDDAPELENKTINDIHQDQTGYLWLATNVGLLRYDGRTFKAFRHVEGDSTSIANNQILSIDEDAAGDLWLALGRGGFSRYFRRTGLFQNFTFTRRLDPSTTPVTAVFHDRDGQVWAGTAEKGVARVDKKTGNFELFDIVTRQTSSHLKDDEIAWANHPYHFWQNPADGKIWQTTRDGYFILDPKTGRSEPRHNPKITQRIGKYFNVWGIQQDGDWLWSGGWQSGMQSVNTRTGEQKQFFYHPSPPDEATTNIVNGIVPKNDDEFWVTTGDHGLGIFNKKTEQFRFFDGKEERLSNLSMGFTRNLLRDRQGNVWFEQNGVLIQILIENSLFQTETVEKLHGEFWINRLFEDREGRFLFTAMHGYEGLRVLEKKSGRQFSLGFKNPPGVDLGMLVQSVRQAVDGRIWVLTRHEIFEFDPVSLKLKKVVQPPVLSKNEPSNYYSEFEIDKKGRFWLGSTNGGIILFDPKTGETRQFLPALNDPNAIPTDEIGVLILDKQDRCWFGSRGKTCYGYFLENENRFVRLDPDGQPTLDKASMRANSIYLDRRGDVWLSSESGLLRFDCSGALPVFSKKYTSADGLPTDYIFRLAEDAEGKIWGLAMNQIFSLDPKSHKIRGFGKREGFDLLGPHGILFRQDDRMYVFGGSKMTKFDPAKMQPAKVEPRLVLTSFRVDDHENYPGSEPLPAETLLVPADSRYFSLEFAALDFANPETHEFEYFFEGFDNQWVKSGTRRLFSFTNVPAGQYFFKVKLAGAPDSEAISVPLRVEVSFFKTSWFWILVAAAIAAAAWRFFKNRRAQERQLQELKSRTQLLEKEKAVVMYESLKQQLNPHFLFNSLTSLSSLIQIDPKSAARFLENLSKTYRYILKSSERETVPLGEELKFAESFVRLQKTRFEQGLEVNFEVPEEFFHRKIVPVTLQNLLENAIKHNIIDEESPLVIEVFIENDCLVVRNNLQRKSFVETSNRKGLAKLRSFYRFLSDREIKTVEGGAFFTINIPLL